MILLNIPDRDVEESLFPTGFFSDLSIMIHQKLNEEMTRAFEIHFDNSYSGVDLKPSTDARERILSEWLTYAILKLVKEVESIHKPVINSDVTEKVIHSFEFDQKISKIILKFKRYYIALGFLNNTP